MPPINSIQKITKVFKEARLSEDILEEDTSSKQIVKKAEREDNFYKYTKDVFFCCYKIMYQNSPSVVFVFSFNLHNSSTGSSAITEQIMSIVSLLERHFVHVFTEYDISRDKNSNYIGLFKYIVPIEEDSII